MAQQRTHGKAVANVDQRATQNRQHIEQRRHAHECHHTPDIQPKGRRAGERVKERLGQQARQ